MKTKMQNSKREELKKMVNEYQENCYWKAEGWGDNVPSEEDLEKELESILDYFDSEISKAKEEMFTKDEVWTLSALVESKIDEIWDTMTLGTEKIVQEQSDDLHRLLSKLTTK